MENSIFPVIGDEESKLPFILKSIGVREDQEHMVRPDGHPDYHWLHCTHGEGKLFMGDQEYDIRPRNGFFLCPGVPHEYFGTIRPWETHWITFNGPVVAGLVSLFAFGQSRVYMNLDIPRLHRVLNDIYTYAQTFTPYKGYECSHLVYKFMIELKYCVNSTLSCKGATYERLQPVLEYIEANCENTLSLDEIAAVIHVTPRHLCRLFKQAFNMSVFDYLTGYRIRKAKEILISSPGLSIGTVAQMVGYHNLSYFCSSFKDSENLTPLGFKRLNKLF